MTMAQTWKTNLKKWPGNVTMSYSDSLRQQAKWIKEALDPATPQTQRVDLGDIDTDELEAAASEIERLRRALKLISDWPITDRKANMDAVNMASVAADRLSN